MAIRPLRFRGAPRRLAAVDAYRFPAGVRQQFAFQHAGMSPDDLRTVEDAARQWFRLGARHPRARLAMPSVAVAALCRAFVVHTRDYQQFCDEALARAPQYEPAAAAGPIGKRLQQTFRLAREDEQCAAPVLPLLFRVDREVGVPGGRSYLADCGGRGQCYPLPDTICLTHLTGMGRRIRGDFRGPDGAPPSVYTNFADGCGGG
jgi:hypothetical protein